jgi:hypothetical protein
MNSAQSAAVFFFLACIIFTLFLGDWLSLNLGQMGIGGYSSISGTSSSSSSVSGQKLPMNIF